MPIVMGTAGHIDHGKTTLVKALTGIDCDRLGEEKERGISIELGFSYLSLPDGGKLSIVDVPGHERFIRNMVAGTAGIGFVMLVVAADEGVMPQTREHLEICSLLGIKNGLVALTKIDTVEKDWLALVEEDLKSYLKGSFLEGAPICPVSSHTGEGLEELRDKIVKSCSKISLKRRSDLPRLPVDRVFTLHGHGTIVTGTLLSGHFDLGQNLVLMPSGKTSRARGLQSHGVAVEEAGMGYRTAVNLPELEVSDIHRGEVLTLPDRLFSSDVWTVDLQSLSSAPRAIRNRIPIHFYHGAKQVQARLIFPDQNKLEPGERSLCTVRFDEPMVGVFGDPFVVRAYSPLQTIAGGVLLHPMGITLRKRDKRRARKLDLLESLARNGIDSSLEEGILAQLELAEEKGASFNELGVLVNYDASSLEKTLQNLSSQQKLFMVDREEKLYVSGVYIESLSSDCLAWFKGFHEREPLKTGVSRNALISGWGKGLNPKLAHFVLTRLQGQEKISFSGDMLSLSGHSVVLDKDSEEIKEGILAIYKKSGATPPNLKEVLEKLDLKEKEAIPVVNLLLKQGDLIKLTEDIYYPSEEIESIKTKVRSWFDANEKMGLADIREISGGLSRKYLIALLEYFDATRFTLRTGDARILRNK